MTPTRRVQRLNRSTPRIREIGGYGLQSSFVLPDPFGRERAVEFLEAQRKPGGRVAQRVKARSNSRSSVASPRLSLSAPAFFGNGGADLPSALDSITTPDMPLPFWSPVYRATVEAVRDALNPDVSNSELGKISDIRAHEISWLLHRRGHTQGIAVGAGRVLVSVEEKKVSSKKSYDGRLLVYQTPLQSGDGASVEINLRDDLPGDGWPHAVVGQGVLGRSISDSVGRHFPNELGMLCPVTNGRQGDFPGDPFDGAPTDLRDRDGRHIATHWHGRGWPPDPDHAAMRTSAQREA